MYELRGLASATVTMALFQDRQTIRAAMRAGKPTGSTVNGRAGCSSTQHVGIQPAVTLNLAVRDTGEDPRKPDVFGAC